MGVLVKCWFWEDNEIDVDLLPEDVDCEAKAEGIFVLMRTIAETLRRRVFLIAENMGSTQQGAEEYAICAFDPSAQG